MIHSRVARCARWTVAVDGALLVMVMMRKLMNVEQKLEQEQWDGGLACHWFATRDGAGWMWGWPTTEPLKVVRDH